MSIIKKMPQLKFTVLQYIFAKGKGLHCFLKAHGLNNQTNVFFLPMGGMSQSTDVNDGTVAYMLTIKGHMKAIKENKGVFCFAPVYDDSLLTEAVALLKEAVECEGRSCFYQTLKEIESAITSSQPLF